MIDTNINIENYVSWLFALGKAIEDKPALIERHKKLTLTLYLLTQRQLLKAGHKSQIFTKLEQHWKGEQTRLTEKIDKLNELIGGLEVMNEFQNRGLQIFVPTDYEAANIQSMRKNALESLNRDLTKALKYPTLPKAQIIEQKLNDLIYKFSDIYSDPDKKPIMTIVDGDAHLWRTSVAFDLSYDLATFDFVRSFQNLKENELPKTPQASIFTSTEAEDIFFNILHKIGLWNPNSKAFSFPDIRKKPATIRGIINAFDETGIIWSTNETEQYKAMKTILNLPDLKDYTRNKDRPTPTITTKTAEKIIEALKNHYSSIFQK